MPTTWPRYRMKLERVTRLELATSTFGKVALYRMSYTRIKWCPVEPNQRHADFQSAAYLLSYRGVRRKMHRCEEDKIGDPERTRTVDLQRDRLAC